MSATYEVKGFVTIIKKIDKTIHCSQSSTPDEIAELVKSNIESEMGLIEMPYYKLDLTRIN